MIIFTGYPVYTFSVSVNMNERSDGWLSKAHPPKSLLKRSAVVRQKGPLSRSTPPRAMLMNTSRLNLYTSYLTQNSPPPPQLMLATKQSTLGDYFRPKEDKVKSRIQEMSVLPKEIVSSSISCDADEYQHEETFRTTAENKCQIYDETSQPFHMIAENKHQIYDQTRLKHSQCLSPTSDLPLTLHNSNVLDKHMHYGRDHSHFRQSVRTYEKLDSAVSSSEKYLRSVDCVCSKENCLQGFKRVCLFCRGANKECVISSGDGPKPGQGHVYQDQGLHDTDISRQAGEFVTFSEGMELLSQEHTEADHFSHSQPSCLSHVWSQEDECFLSGHTALANLEGPSDSQGFHCVTQDASRQYVDILYPSSEVKVALDNCADSQDVSSLHTVREQTRSPECVNEDSHIGELEEFVRVNNNIEFTLPHSSDNEIGCTNDCETPDFAETFTVSIADTVNGTQSIHSQLELLRGEQFQKRKAQYMSEFGTLVLSENI